MAKRALSSTEQRTSSAREVFKDQGKKKKNGQPAADSWICRLPLLGIHPVWASRALGQPRDDGSSTRIHGWHEGDKGTDSQGWCRFHAAIGRLGSRRGGTWRRRGRGASRNAHTQPGKKLSRACRGLRALCGPVARSVARQRLGAGTAGIGALASRACRSCHGRRPRRSSLARAGVAVSGNFPFRMSAAAN